MSGKLAEFSVGLRREDIPERVRHEARRSLVNYMACALAGSTDPAAGTAFSVLRRFAGGEEATIVGRRERSDMLTAAFMNAMAANAFDFDDTHEPTIIHPTAPVAPALFAFAESRRLSGADLLDAFIVGVEVECRIGNAVSPGHYRRGWHITSTCGVFGAAAAMSRVLGLDPRGIVWAFGNASVQASGIVETLGTMSKSIGVGNAARNGLLSALLAEGGFSGPAAPLEGARGFLHVTADEPDLAAITEGLGESWELLANTYKPYPCGVVLNPVIEACLELAREPGFSVERIESIELTGHPLLRQRTDRPGISTGRESQVSAQHAVPAALIRGRAGLAEFSDECVADPSLRALGEKVRFTEDAGFGVESARVTLHTADGPRSRHVEHARGSLACPLTDGDLEEKLLTLADYSGAGCCDAGRLIEALWSIEGADDSGAVMALARRPA